MDKNSAIQLIENTFNAKFDENQFVIFIKNLLNDIEIKNNSYSGNYIWDDYKEHINSYKRFAKYIDPEGEALDILVVEVKSLSKLEKARTTLRNFVIKHLDKFEKDYALVAFYTKEDNGEDWRFSFIKLEHQSYLDEDKQKVKTRKEFTPAKRYSFLVGEHEKAHTAKNQILPLLQSISNNPTVLDIESAFSIEKVTDEFFNQYKELYVKLFEHFANDAHIRVELQKANIDNARFTKKLLGQIVFLYFLQKKGWLGVPKNEFWGKGKKRFIQDLFDTAQIEGVNFFKDKLQHLFYEALAVERDNENSFYPKFNCRIPFLNGGLFEAEYNWQQANITIPVDLFRNDEKNKAGDIGTGVLDVLDRYNFTIKEDEPLDKEVAVDPEMLGKVFENMLEITERKSKGAFYTPREIVHYMCQESLIHYLDNSLNEYSETYREIGSSQTNMFGNQGNTGQHSIQLSENKILVPKQDIENYIREGHLALENDMRVASKGESKTYKYKLPETIRNNADKIDKKLSEIKICDPAIGSGAFPVGLLHELVCAQLVLKPHFSEKYLHEKLQNLNFDKTNEELNENRYVYRLKRHIIQESIYGVDIDASAIDIARLRLWLSLIVDEDNLEPIETLPNLDYKIVCGNSLIGMPENAMRNLEVEKELEALKEKFYDETNETEKKNLRTQINKKIRVLLDSAEQFAGYKIDFDFKLFFSEVWREKGGFDVVIGNPPYIAGKSGIITNEFKKIYNLNYETAEYQLDTYILFIEKGHKILRKEGVFSYIIPNPWLANHRLIKIRQFLLSKTEINEIVLLQSDIFKNASVDTLVLIFRKIISNKNTIKIVEYKDNLFKQKHYIKQNSLKENKKFVFDINLNESHRKIIKNIEENTIQLIDISDINRGVHAYRKDGYGKSKYGKGYQTQQDYDEKSYHADSKLDETYFPEVRGKNLNTYYYETNGLFISYGDWLAEPREMKYFTGERIYLRKIIGKTLYCAYVRDKNIADQSVYIAKIKNTDFFVKYVLAILNSKLISWYFRICNNEFDDLFPQIKVTEFKEIPIKILDKSFQKKIVAVVDYVILVKKFNIEKISFFLERLIDGIVFELYFPNEFQSSNKHILSHLGDLQPLSDDMSEEEKLSIIQSEYERLSHPEHPLKYNLDTLDEIEEVRVIREGLK